MRISDWSSDVCSSDLDDGGRAEHYDRAEHLRADAGLQRPEREEQSRQRGAGGGGGGELRQAGGADLQYVAGVDGEEGGGAGAQQREESKSDTAQQQPVWTDKMGTVDNLLERLAGSVGGADGIRPS